MMVIVMSFAEKEVVHSNVCGEGNDRNAEARKEVAKHHATRKDWMFPPRLVFGPRIFEKG